MIKYLRVESYCILNKEQLKVYVQGGYELVTFSPVISGKYIYYFKDINPSKDGEKIETKREKQYLFNEINACCPYCDFQSRGDFFKVKSVMEEHEVFCSEHPMRKLELENKELKDALLSIMNTEGLTISLSSDLKQRSLNVFDLSYIAEFNKNYDKAINVLNKYVKWKYQIT